MPQLGMTQNTGLIVAWHKKPGDAVASDDVLMEVETDKATMEVPAGVSGYLTEIRAEAGSEVPVGNVIAVIGDSADAVAEMPAPPPAEQKAEAPPVPAPAKPAPAKPEPTEAKPAPQSAPPSAPITTAPPSDRVLASPKAKYLARERGIDLKALAAQGIPQPFHAADVERFQAAPATAAAAQFGSFDASVPRAAFDALFAMSGLENLNRAVAFGAFAASARRAVADDPSAPIAVACRSVPGDAMLLNDPDRGGLSQIADAGDAGEPAIMVHDLTGTRISGYRPAGGAHLQLSVSAEGGDNFAVTLAFDEARASVDEAAAFLDAFLARIENPILHIV